MVCLFTQRWDSASRTGNPHDARRVAARPRKTHATRKRTRLGDPAPDVPVFLASVRTWTMLMPRQAPHRFNHHRFVVAGDGYQAKPCFRPSRISRLSVRCAKTAHHRKWARKAVSGFRCNAHLLRERRNRSPAQRILPRRKAIRLMSGLKMRRFAAPNSARER